MSLNSLRILSIFLVRHSVLLDPGLVCCALNPSRKIIVSVVVLPVVYGKDTAENRFVFLGEVQRGGFRDEGLVRCIFPTGLVFNHWAELPRLSPVAQITERVVTGRIFSGFRVWDLMNSYAENAHAELDALKNFVV